MSFIDQLLKTSKDDIFLVKGRSDNKYCWHYVLVDQNLKREFDLKIKAKKFVNLEEYGKVIVSGWGVEPPQIVKDKIEEFGASYDAENDSELEAYYKGKSDVFFLMATSQGRDCYYYVAVDGKLADEFQRVCAEEAPDFADYGNIIESGWDAPSQTVIAYMKEKYGVNTPELEDA